jgi:hypothetical protein
MYGDREEERRRRLIDENNGKPKRWPLAHALTARPIEIPQS